MTETKKKMDSKKLIKLAVFGILTIFMITSGYMTPFAGLEQAAMQYIGVFVWWLGTMIMGLVPAYIATLAGCVLAVVFGAAPATTAFSSFSGSTAWLLIGAFGLAGGLGNSGIMKRLALNIMRIFPGTYLGQMVAMTVSSIVIGPTIPSTAAKCAILVPLAGTISEEMGFEPHSRGTVGLFSIVNTITNFVGCMFLTGGLLVAIMLGVSGATVSWFEWLSMFGVWGVVLTVLVFIFHIIYYNPKKDGNDGKIDKTVLVKKCKELGPMSVKEKIATVITLGTLILWMTEGTLHTIPTYIVALGAWLILYAAGLFSDGDLKMKILWSVFIQVGGLLGMITMLSATGVSSWIGTSVAPIVSSLGSSYLILIAVSILATAGQFVLVTGTVSSTIFVALLASTTINPAVIAFVAIMSASVHLMEYMQISVISALGISGGKVVHKDIQPSALMYILFQFIAILVSLPWWNMLGLL